MLEHVNARLSRLVRHARRGWALCVADPEARRRARDWLHEHPSSYPEADRLWFECLDGRGPLAAWLGSDATPEHWTGTVALHSLLACHPFPDLPQWTERQT